MIGEYERAFLRGPVPAGRSKEQGKAHDPVHAGAAKVIAYLRASSFTLTYDPRERTLRAGTQDAAAMAIDRKLTGKAEKGAELAGRAPALAGGRAGVTLHHAWIQAHMGNLCVRGGIAPKNQCVLAGEFAVGSWS